METQVPSGRAGSDADVTSDREIGLYYVCGFCSKFEFAKFLAENCAKMIEFEMDFNGCYDGAQLLHIESTMDVLMTILTSTMYMKQKLIHS